MAVLRFGSDAVRCQCCDAALMRARWGSKIARCLSRRLQQLEAMTTLDDLDFLPFDSHRNGDGTIRVTVTPDLALVIEPTSEELVRGTAMLSITITQVLATSIAARSV